MRAFSCFQWPIYALKQFLIPILLIVISLGTCSMAFAQSSWYGLVDEPKLISVAGTLNKPSSIVVHAVIDGKDTTLHGHTARAFLYLRSYLTFDDTALQWRTTEKYKVWKKQFNKPPPAVPSIPGSGISFVPGSPPQGCRYKSTCFSSYGQNEKCRKNGCIEPPGSGKMYCFWRCQISKHKSIKIRGRDGKRL